MSHNKGETYKYIRICKLPSCKKSFETNRKWQEFCCDLHRIEYWKVYRRYEFNIEHVINQLKKDFGRRLAAIENHLGINKEEGK